ncbi:MAG: acyl-CoA thioesterase [Nocardioides sp.]|nr:acyl-CoA thioesterase [Nocardioides sp.]
MTDERTSHPPTYSRVSLAQMMHSTSANLLGNVHGGDIMKLADSTAGAAAQRHSGGPAVTAALDEMAFLEPVHVGDIVRTTAQFTWAGRSSMEIGVRIEAEPWSDASGQPLHVGSAYFVFVAVDEHGHSREIPGIEPQTSDEVRRLREAEIRRAHRLAVKQEIDQGRKGD